MFDSFVLFALMEEKVEAGHPVDVAAKLLQSFEEIPSIADTQRLSLRDTQ
jgi:hypothetical protein